MRTGRQRCWRVLRVVLLTAALTVASGKIAETSFGQSPPTISPQTVPATGRHEALPRVFQFGRYAVTVGSRQGTGLQLLDRIAGPGGIQGAPGTTDGRLDVFLDRGEHKIVTHADDKGSGDATLSVHAFSERNGTQPPLLVELKPVDTALDDLEQRAYWVEVKERRQVLFEAAGRNLADLRLWSNGDWLVAVAPEIEVVTPQPGRPLRLCRLAATLDPGFYLLTAYGGLPQPWTGNSAEHPFHLRFGIPELGSAGRARYAVSPFGVDRWLVPGPPNYFRLELPEARPAEIAVSWFDAQRPFEAGNNSARIDKNSLLPVAEVESSGQGGKESARQLITVSAAAGQPYLLQHFDSGEPYFSGGRVWRIHDDGRYWVSTIHAGDPADSVDATGILMRTPRWHPQDPHVPPFASQVVDPAKGQGWARRFNLLAPVTLFFHVDAAGKYEVVSRGVEAKFRIEPFFIEPPEHYEVPDSHGTGWVWDLNPGTYVLRAEPVKKGIINVALRPANPPGAPDPFATLLGKDREAELRSLRAAVQFPEIDVDHNYYYTLFLNEQQMPSG